LAMWFHWKINSRTCSLTESGPTSGAQAVIAERLGLGDTRRKTCAVNFPDSSRGGGIG
jgi:hypothetical protein